MFSDAQNSAGMVQVIRNNLTGVPVGIHGQKAMGHDGISPEALLALGER